MVVGRLPGVVTAEQVEGWGDEFWEFFLGFSHWFSRADVRWQAWKYLRGLMATIERRSGWSLAEHAGDATPDKMQGLLVSRCLDRDKLRDQVRSALVAAIGDEAGVLVADETGFIKKGRSSAGVQRQYTGTTGKIDNCQLGVFLTYHTRHGRALIDRELYLPKSWTDDRDRCRRAHIGDDVEFATKPEQARSMLERAVGAKVPFAWFTGDEAYGQNRALREWCEEQDIAYVLATRKDHEVASGLHTSTRVDELIAKVRAGAWRRMSCGDGAHGPRVYDWISVPIRTTFQHGRRGWVLARRSITSGELAYYVCFGPRGTRLRTLVRTAGARWAVEESFQIAKNEAGLDQYQFRRYDAWYAHITLSMAAAAFLTITRAREAVKGAPPATATRTA